MDFNTSVVVIVESLALAALAFFAGYKTGEVACGEDEGEDE